MYIGLPGLCRKSMWKPFGVGAPGGFGIWQINFMTYNILNKSIRQITSTVLVLFIHEIIPLENYKFFKGVSMDKITHQVRAEHWAKIMNECINSGMSKTAWCRANGISEKQFFYWQRILRREAFEKSQNLTLPVTVSQDQLPATQRTVAFTEIKLPSSPQNTAPVFRPDLVIRKGNLILEIANSASEDLLSRIRGILNAE